MLSISDIVKTLSKIVDYINSFFPESREKDYSIKKLEEAVFWLTYLDESDD